MSKTWLTWSTSLLLQGLVLMLVLGPCQCQFLSADAWSKSNVLDVFATVPQLANEASGAHTIQQTHNNNVTLTDEETDDETEEDLDLDLNPLAPHAAVADAATDAASMMPLSQRKLSRGKRFVAFPLGSSASVAVCLTTGVLGNPDYLYLSFGLNWGVAYDLPNITWVLNNAHGWNTKKPMAAVAKIKRRHRRDVYGNLETMIDSMGYNGRDCVLRTLCESRQYFQRTKLNMVGEMLRAIFSLPKQRIFKRELEENADIVHYDNAYRHAHDFDCEKQYDCQFSLLKLAFGKYSTPPKNYYAQ
ncbi:uncharacterized protein LOC133838994 isoform X1 [Drosophila sulfurigaster albostrigata]|uniref:uncharacterized protein LOC133838994 isoform X1 n=1 Tax=Drosophila sulfurigaster albostrigata TaxID=89887 RepID=UPI002D218402|nr:uncharacterized protein LOC133838994 isoform X1 [Drosophila sulfurigaster albostrigata]